MNKKEQPGLSFILIAFLLCNKHKDIKLTYSTDILLVQISFSHRLSCHELPYPLGKTASFTYF